MNIDPFGGYGVRVTLPTPDNFLIVVETLTRMGIPSFKEKILYQSCHLLHKKREGISYYAILSFKELFLLDHRHHTVVSEDDYNRRNLIVKLLSDWKLINVVDTEKLTNLSQNCNVKVISSKDKQDWTLEAKYSVGTKKHYGKNPSGNRSLS